MTPKVLLDLSLPAFHDDLLALEPSEVRLVLKALRKLRTLDWAAVYRDPGLIVGADGAPRLSARARAREIGPWL